MPSSQYLIHHTINTGHSARIDLTPDAQIAVDSVGVELLRALRDGQTDIRLGNLTSGPPHYQLRATADGPGLICTILSPIRGAPLVTWGVARKSRGARQLWEILNGYEPGHAKNIGEMPPVPWLVARIETTIVLDPRALSWVADYEQLVAWAWVQKLDRTQKYD